MQMHKPKPRGKTFPCDQCDYIATKKIHLKQHKQTTHTVQNQMHIKPILVETFPRDKSDTATMKIHFKLRNKIGIYLCDHCSFTTKTIRALRYHLMVKHYPQPKILTEKNQKIGL